MSDRGSYSPSNRYYVGDIVVFDDAKWTSTKRSIGIIPGTDSTHWQKREDHIQRTIGDPGATTTFELGISGIVEPYDPNDDLTSSGDGPDFGDGPQEGDIGSDPDRPDFVIVPGSLGGNVGDIIIGDDDPTDDSSDAPYTPALFEVDRRPMTWIGLSNMGQYYDVRNDNGMAFRKTHTLNPDVDGVAWLVDAMEYHRSSFGAERFLLQSPSGNTLKNTTANSPDPSESVRAPFCYYGSNTWTGMRRPNTVLTTDNGGTVKDGYYYEKPWTASGDPVYPTLSSKHSFHIEDSPADPTGVRYDRQMSYSRYLRPWLESHPRIEFIPYGGIQVPFKADGTLDYGILANARRKGQTPYAADLYRFPRFNSSIDSHKAFFKAQMDGWSNSSNGRIKSLGFDTGSDIHRPEPGERTGDAPRWFLSQGFKPYGEAVAFDWSSGEPRPWPLDVYRTAPYIGLYHGIRHPNIDQSNLPSFAHPAFWDGPGAAGSGREEHWRNWRFNELNTEVHIIMNWYWMKTSGWTLAMVQETVEEMRERGYVVSIAGCFRNEASMATAPEDEEFIRLVMENAP